MNRVTTNFATRHSKFDRSLEVDRKLWTTTAEPFCLGRPILHLPRETGLEPGISKRLRHIPAELNSKSSPVWGLQCRGDAAYSSPRLRVCSLSVTHAKPTVDIP